MHEAHHSESEPDSRHPKERALGFFLAFLLFFRREKTLTFFGESVELAFEFFSGLVVHTRRYIPN
jgi:hypothetical protein